MKKWILPAHAGRGWPQARGGETHPAPYKRAGTIHLPTVLLATITLALATQAATPAPPPPAPALTVTATAGPKGVHLTWKAPGPIRDLRVIRSTGPLGLAEPDPDLPLTRLPVPPTATAYLDAAPADGTPYAYRVEGRVAGQPVAGVATVDTPPRALPPLRAPAIAVDKAAYTLTVLDGGRVAKRYPIALGGAPTRRKVCFDNASTPEGRYRIIGVQPRATYHRAYDIDYPTPLDRVRHAVTDAQRPERPPIGGEIQIHGRGIGRNWTFGCIALRDADMDELFGRPAIGVGTPVAIWGGELTEADVMAMAGLPGPAELARWRAALTRAGHPTDGRWGPGIWAAIGHYQLAAGLPPTCWPDAATARSLKFAP